MGRKAVSTVKLSVEGLTDLAAALRNLADSMDTATDAALDKGLTAGKTMMESSLASATDGYGTIDGNDPGYVFTRVEYMFGGDSYLGWAGPQVKFIEFGYGAMGAADPYPSQLPAGYRPDPEKEEWEYVDGMGNRRKSYSLGALAPLYLTGRQLAQGRRPLSRFLSSEYDKIYPRGVFK